MNNLQPHIYIFEVQLMLTIILHASDDIIKSLYLKLRKWQASGSFDSTEL